MTDEIFDAFAAYYDLLYADKPYAKEANFLNEIIREHRPEASSILDLGCGTGVHAWLLAELGYTVLGIDQSEAMLVAARARGSSHPKNAPTFALGRLESFGIASPVDVVVSLFDVVSYLRDYRSVKAFAANVAGSLQKGGLLIFDCWYGPGVYTQKPGTRLRKFANSEIAVTRVASGTLHHAHNHIDVAYNIFVEKKRSGTIVEFSELHKVRCFFDDELDDIFANCGLRRIQSMQWFTRAVASIDTWSVLFVFGKD